MLRVIATGVAPSGSRCCRSFVDVFGLFTAPLSEKLCSKLKGPHQHSFGGWRMLDAGDIEPAIVLYLAKFQEYRFRYTVQEAEAEIAAAAQKCASR